MLQHSVAAFIGWDSLCRSMEEPGNASLTPAELDHRLELLAGADAVREPELVLVSLSTLTEGSPEAPKDNPDTEILGDNGKAS